MVIFVCIVLSVSLSEGFPRLPDDRCRRGWRWPLPEPVQGRKHRSRASTGPCLRLPRGAALLPARRSFRHRGGDPASVAEGPQGRLPAAAVWGPRRLVGRGLCCSGPPTGLCRSWELELLGPVTQVPTPTPLPRGPPAPSLCLSASLPSVDRSVA